MVGIYRLLQGRIGILLKASPRHVNGRRRRVQRDRPRRSPAREREGRRCEAVLAWLGLAVAVAVMYLRAVAMMDVKVKDRDFTQALMRQ